MGPIVGPGSDPAMLGSARFRFRRGMSPPPGGSADGKASSPRIVRPTVPCRRENYGLPPGVSGAMAAEDAIDQARIVTRMGGDGAPALAP